VIAQRPFPAWEVRYGRIRHVRKRTARMSYLFSRKSGAVLAPVFSSLYKRLKQIAGNLVLLK
jgi:hypothetical protein